MQCPSFFREYRTITTITILDSRLAIINRVLQALVLVYVAIQILVFQKYAVLEKPTGFVENYHYDDLSHLDASPKFPDYCNTSLNWKYNYYIDGIYYSNITCRDAMPTEFVRALTSEFAIGVFQTEMDWENGSLIASRNIFFRGAEYVTLGMLHGYRSTFDSGSRVETRVFAKDGKIALYAADGQFSRVPTWKLLQLAGFTLDDPHPPGILGQPPPFFRYTGAYMLVRVTYRNTDRSTPYIFKTVADITVEMVDDLWGSDTDQIVYQRYPTKFTTISRQSIRIRFTFEGNLAKFDIFNLILSVLSGVVLLSVSIAVVDFFAAHWRHIGDRFQQLKTRVVSLDEPDEDASAVQLEPLDVNSRVTSLESVVLALRQEIKVLQDRLALVPQVDIPPITSYALAESEESGVPPSPFVMENN